MKMLKKVLYFAVIFAMVLQLAAGLSFTVYGDNPINIVRPLDEFVAREGGSVTVAATITGAVTGDVEVLVDGTVAGVAELRSMWVGGAVGIAPAVPGVTGAGNYWVYAIETPASGMFEIAVRATVGGNVVVSEPVTVEVRGVEGTTAILNQDFAGYTAAPGSNVQPAGWTAPPADVTLGSAQTPGSDDPANRSLRFERTTGGWGGDWHWGTVPPFGGVVTMELSVFPTGDGFMPMRFGSGGAASTMWQLLGFGGGHIQFGANNHDGLVNLTPYTPNEWYHFRMEFNFYDEWVDLFINDVQYIAHMDFSNLPETFNRGNLFQMRFNSGAVGVWYISDIHITRHNMAPPPPPPPTPVEIVNGVATLRIDPEGTAHRHNGQDADISGFNWGGQRNIVGGGTYDPRFLHGRGTHAIYMQFNAEQLIPERDNIERAVLRVHHHHHRWSYFSQPAMALPFFLFDPWPANGRLWSRDTISWHVAQVGSAQSDGFLTNSSPQSPEGHAVTLGIGSQPQYAGAAFMPYTLSTAALASGNPGAFIAGFSVGRGIDDRWYEIDVTDYVRASMADVGERGAIGVSGTGWGRDGIINFGMRQHLFPGPTDSLRANNFSSSRNPNGNGPQLVIYFSDYDDGFITQTATAIDNATVEQANFEGNTNVIDSSAVLATRRFGYQNFIASFLKFDTSDFAAPLGYEIYDAQLRLTVVNHQGGEVHYPRAVAVSVAHDDWDGDTAVMADMFELKEMFPETHNSGSLQRFGFRPMIGGEVRPGVVGTVFSPTDTVYVDVTSAIEYIGRTQRYAQMQPIATLLPRPPNSPSVNPGAQQGNDPQWMYVYPDSELVDPITGFRPFDPAIRPFSRHYLRYSSFEWAEHESDPDYLSFMLYQIGGSTGGSGWQIGDIRTEFAAMGTTNEPMLIVRFRPTIYFDSINIVDSGTSVTVRGRNDGGTENLTADVVFAMYDEDGRLLDVVTGNAAIPPAVDAGIVDATITWNRAFPALHAETRSVRAFLWDSVSGMTPVLRAASDTI